MSMVFSAVQGSRFADADAAIIGPRLIELSDSLERPVTPDDIVADAKAESSTLHPYFLWDDAAAAEKYRIAQAQHMVRSINITVTGEGVEPITTRAFHVITAHDEARDDDMRGYHPTIRIMSDDALMAQVITRARQELDGWRRRYKQYSALRVASDEILRIIETLMPEVERVDKAA